MGVGPKRLAVALLAAGALAPAAAREPDAQQHRVEEVRLPGLAIGRTYSTWRLQESPLVVRNSSSDTLRFRVEIVLPARHELRAGARPVPDRGWVTIESREFDVMPHSEHRADVRLTLPYDPDLAGHVYQVDVACAERGRHGWIVRQRSRLVFAVEMDYRDDTEIDLAAAHGSRRSSAR